MMVRSIFVFLPQEDCMTYFKACKLNCWICKTYFCFEPLLPALSFANSATLELTPANRNLGFQSSPLFIIVYHLTLFRWKNQGAVAFFHRKNVNQLRFSMEKRS